MAGIFGLYRWFKDRQAERDKQKIVEENLFKDRQIDRERRAEERFQLVVEGLGSEKLEARVGAAIMLRTFLQPGYEQFYNQAFDLSVANLRMRSVNPNLPNSIDPLSQAVIVVFKESFPRTREELRKLDPQFSPEYLDATCIQLDKAYLVHADLKEIWMPEASLQASNLNNAKLTRANLSGAHLSQANFSNTQLSEAILNRADLTWANLVKANLTKADLKNSNLLGTDMSGADLTGVDLTGANPEDAKSLQKTKMSNNIGLTQTQRDLCKKKGAIIEDTDGGLVTIQGI